MSSQKRCYAAAAAAMTGTQANSMAVPSGVLQHGKFHRSACAHWPTTISVVYVHTSAKTIQSRFQWPTSVHATEQQLLAHCSWHHAMHSKQHQAQRVQVGCSWAALVC